MKQKQIKKILADYISGFPIEMRKINSNSKWTLCESAIDKFDFQKYEYRTAKHLDEFNLIDLEEHPTIVDYHGYEFYIPKEYNYIATDSGGSVYSYKQKPFFDGVNWSGSSPIFLGNFIYAGNAKNSLMEIDCDY